MEILYSEIEKELKNIPKSIGVFALKVGNTPLFIKSTENLQKFISVYCDKITDDNFLKEIQAKAKIVWYQEHSLLIEAFIEEQILIHKNEIAAQINNFKPWSKYIYLGVNFDRPPFFKVSPDTTEDYYYLGPFRSSFVLNDTLDVFSDLFKLPRCEMSYPMEIKNIDCDRLKNEKCLGFCQNKLSEALPEMLNRMVMLPDKKLIIRLEAEKEALKDNLEFLKADHLSEQISLLKRYYKSLLFFYTSQYIEGEFKINDTTLFVEQGVIKEIVANNDYVELFHPSLSNRKNNELLAYDKSDFDHRWIVFDYIYETYPEQIESLYIDNLQELQEKIFK